MIKKLKKILRNIIISEEAKFWKFVTSNKFLIKLKLREIKIVFKNYLNNGYYDVNVQSVTAKFNENGTFKLTYKIDAGDIYSREC